MHLAISVSVWVLAVVGSLISLGNKEPLDRLRIINLWVGGFVCWALCYQIWSPTQVAAGVMLADAGLSFVLIGFVVARRLAATLGSQDRP